MRVINPSVLIIMGIMFEVIGALFLALESFGSNRISKMMSFVNRLSRWSKQSFVNLFIVGSPLVILLSLAIFFEIEALVGLTIPILSLVIFHSVLMDNSSQIENWLLMKTTEKRISPIGFILLLIGNVFQIISVIWQMQGN